ncbi:MAG: HAMP domain-containing histidine kinase [Bacteroidetes bacterium]|nr:HAMP domain-containing histidine kinase [Bacteroidota bacterium]
MNPVGKTGKLGIIRLLMITAQLLLMAFVGHWLSLQYKSQKSLLSQNIDDAWSKSQQQVIDSMLMKDFIMPAIDTSAKFDFKFEFNTDSIRAMVHSNNPPVCIPDNPLHLPKSTLGRQSRIIVRVDDSVSSSTFNTQVEHEIMTRDLVLRGVKLFVNEHIDSTGGKPELYQIMSKWPDTILFKRNFMTHINAISPSLKAIWKTVRLNDTSTRKLLYQHSLVIENKKLEAGISGSEMYILGKILPQLGFALLLLILTASAFILSFRSLKTQVLLNNQRNDFIRNMSHELKTPVATVKVALEALKNFNRKDDPILMDEYLEMATSETQRLELLIARVMNLSNGNGEAFTLSLENIDLVELIRDILQTLQPRFINEVADVSVMLPAEPIMLQIDRLHIQGVLMNLLDNSLKYSSPPRKIELTLEVTNEYVTVLIADHGIGIPSEYADRIFDKFFRVPAGETHNVKGYGLGLTYAKMVMEQHAGKIEFEPGKAEGSMFRLQFRKS